MEKAQTDGTGGIGSLAAKLILATLASGCGREQREELRHPELLGDGSVLCATGRQVMGDLHIIDGSNDASPLRTLNERIAVINGPFSSWGEYTFLQGRISYGHNGVYVVNRDSGGIELLIKDDGIIPYISGDGKTLAYVKDGILNLQNIIYDGKKVRLDGEPVQLEQKVQGFQLIWHPTQRLLFWKSGQNEFSYASVDDDKNIKDIKVIQFDFDIGQIAVSPDNRYIALEFLEGNNKNIGIVKFDPSKNPYRVKKEFVARTTKGHWNLLGFSQGGKSVKYVRGDPRWIYGTFEGKPRQLEIPQSEGRISYGPPPKTWHGRMNQHWPGTPNYAIPFYNKPRE